MGGNALLLFLTSFSRSVNVYLYTNLLVGCYAIEKLRVLTFEFPTAIQKYIKNATTETKNKQTNKHDDHPFLPLQCEAG